MGELASEYLPILLEREMYNRLKIFASREGRKVDDFVGNVLEDWLTEEGGLLASPHETDYITLDNGDVICKLCGVSYSSPDSLSLHVLSVTKETGS